MATTFKLCSAGAVLALTALLTTSAYGYKQASSCFQCHPKFNSGPMGFDHEAHKGFVKGDCFKCHVSVGDTPKTSYSIDNSDPNNVIYRGCAGCHGRAEDAPNATSTAYAAGLRQHHARAGVTACSGCHSDANPAKYTPVGEDVLPPFYALGVAANNDPCTDNLDNDGDMLTDGADPDCVANTAPFAVDDSYTTDQAVTLDVAAGSGVLVNDTDVDGDALTATIKANAANGTVTLNADGSFQYVPDPLFFGSDTFTYVANDGTVDSNIATVTITVNEVVPANNPPVAVDDSYMGMQDTPLVISTPGVLGNDTDGDSDPLTAKIATGPSAGSVTLNANGSFTYTPGAGTSGTDSFTYVANDGTDNSNAAIVTITVKPAPPVNKPPTASDDAYTVGANQLLDVAGPGVLANDSDLNGDNLSAVLVSDVAKGDLVLNPDGSLSYMPALDFSGTDSFRYKANDGSLDSNVATVIITVTPAPVNQAPFATNDAYSTEANVALNVAAPGVLGNDGDPEGDPLTAILKSDVTNGTLVLNADGSLTYTPNLDYTGVDTFTYVANDGQLDSSIATVSITVTAPPQPGAVDLDITKFKVEDEVKLEGDKDEGAKVEIELIVKNNGTEDGSAPAMLVGVQDGIEVYSEMLMISVEAGEKKKVKFPKFEALIPGTIEWTVLIEDDDPDVDQASAMTKVKMEDEDDDDDDHHDGDKDGDKDKRKH